LCLNVEPTLPGAGKKKKGLIKTTGKHSNTCVGGVGAKTRRVFAVGRGAEVVGPKKKI